MNMVKIHRGDSAFDGDPWINADHVTMIAVRANEGPDMTAVYCVEVYAGGEWWQHLAGDGDYTLEEAQRLCDELVARLMIQQQPKEPTK